MKRLNRDSKMAWLLQRGGLAFNEETPVEAPDAGPGSTPESSSDDSPVGGDDSLDWGGMFDESDEASLDPVTETAAPDAVETPAEPPADQATAPTDPAVTPPEPTQPTEPAAPTEPTTPTEPEQPQQTPEEAATAKATARNNWLENLTEGYQLSEEQSAEMVTDPGKVLPTIAAEMHVRMMENTMQLMNQVLPNMVQQAIHVKEMNQKGDESFYAAWPELRGHEELVLQAGEFWRSKNPTASQEEFIKHVGAMAWNSAGLKLEDLVNRGSETQQPAAPAQPQGGYSPAPQSSPAAPAPTPGDSNNVFTALANEWAEED